MVQFINLPAYQPQNALSFAPITNALQNYQANALAQQRLGMDQQRLAIEQRRADMDFADRERTNTMWNALNADAPPEWARSLPPGVLPAAKMLPGPQGASAIVNAAATAGKGTDDISEYRFAKQNGYQGSFENWMRQVKQKGAEYGKQTVVVQDDKGNFYTLHTASDGTSVTRPLALNAGGGAATPGTPTGIVQRSESDGQAGVIKLSPSKGTKQVGDEIVDVSTGRPVRNVGSGIAGKEHAEEVGKASGKAEADLPRIVDNTNTTVALIDKILADPVKQKATGWGSLIPPIPGTAQRDFINTVEQLKGRTFLEAFNSLRGAGAITEMEGAKATQALARLDRGQTTKGFDEALTELKSILKLGADRARRMAQPRPPQAGVTNGPSPGPGVVKDNMAPIDSGNWGIRRIE